MIALLLASAIMARPPSSEDAAALCKSALARQGGIEIGTMDVSSSKAGRSGRTIEGRLTAFSQMGPAPAGAARTHHLGRFELTYSCRVSGGRVLEARLNPLQP
jgi:hypothetical protein